MQTISVLESNPDSQYFLNILAYHDGKSQGEHKLSIIDDDSVNCSFEATDFNLMPNQLGNFFNFLFLLALV